MCTVFTVRGFSCVYNAGSSLCLQCGISPVFTVQGLYCIYGAGSSCLQCKVSIVFMMGGLRGLMSLHVVYCVYNAESPDSGRSNPLDSHNGVS